MYRLISTRNVKMEIVLYSLTAKAMSWRVQRCMERALMRVRRSWREPAAS